MTRPHDADLDSLLRGYQPVAPPPDLRSRIVSGPPSRRTWPWGVAAAALLVAAIAVQALSDRLIARAATPPPRVDSVEELAALIGDDGSGGRLAALIAADQQVRAQLAQVADETGESGGGPRR